MPEDTTGNKYIIKKTNGEPIDPDARYFVLRIDNGATKNRRAARAALTVYIRESFEDDPEAAKAAHRLLMETQ